MKQSLLFLLLAFFCFSLLCKCKYSGSSKKPTHNSAVTEVTTRIGDDTVISSYHTLTRDINLLDSSIVSGNIHRTIEKNGWIMYFIKTPDNDSLVCEPDPIDKTKYVVCAANQILHGQFIYSEYYEGDILCHLLDERMVNHNGVVQLKGKFIKNDKYKPIFKSRVGEGTVFRDFVNNTYSYMSNSSGNNGDKDDSESSSSTTATSTENSGICSACNGTGKCRKCNYVPFRVHYWGGKYSGWKDRNEIRPGQIMCSTCKGTGVIYGSSFLGDDPETKPCPISGCNGGWLNCPECNYNGNGKNLGKCQRCKGTGRI